MKYILILIATCMFCFSAAFASPLTESSIIIQFPSDDQNPSGGSARAIREYTLNGQLIQRFYPDRTKSGTYLPPYSNSSYFFPSGICGTGKFVGLVDLTKNNKNGGWQRTGLSLFDKELHELKHVSEDLPTQGAANSLRSISCINGKAYILKDGFVSFADGNKWTSLNLVKHHASGFLYPITIEAGTNGSIYVLSLFFETTPNYPPNIKKWDYNHYSGLVVSEYLANGNFKRSFSLDVDKLPEFKLTYGGFSLAINDDKVLIGYQSINTNGYVASFDSNGTFKRVLAYPGHRVGDVQIRKDGVAIFAIAKNWGTAPEGNSVGVTDGLLKTPRFFKVSDSGLEPFSLDFVNTLYESDGGVRDL